MQGNNVEKEDLEKRVFIITTTNFSYLILIKNYHHHHHHHHHHLNLIFELVEEWDVMVWGDFLALPDHKMTMRITNYDKNVTIKTKIRQVMTKMCQLWQKI